MHKPLEGIGCGEYDMFVCNVRAINCRYDCESCGSVQDSFEAGFQISASSIPRGLLLSPVGLVTRRWTVDPQSMAVVKVKHGWYGFLVPRWAALEPVMWSQKQEFLQEVAISFVTLAALCEWFLLNIWHWHTNADNVAWGNSAVKTCRFQLFYLLLLILQVTFLNLMFSRLFAISMASRVTI